MNKKRIKTTLQVLLLFMLTVGLSNAGTAEVGKFLFVFGKVELQRASGEAVSAKKGVAVFEGARIIAHKNGKAQMRLKDGSFLAIRPNTELIIDEYAYQQKGRDNKSVTSLIKGTFRTITGAIGKESPDNVLVKTPVATIGIRGTDHEPAYFPPGAQNTPTGVKPGLYNKVNSGFVFIESTAGFRLPLGPGQSGFMAVGGKEPVILETTPAFYQQPNELVADEDNEGSEEAPAETATEEDTQESTAEDEQESTADETQETVSEESQDVLNEQTSNDTDGVAGETVADGDVVGDGFYDMSSEEFAGDIGAEDQLLAAGDQILTDTVGTDVLADTLQESNVSEAPLAPYDVGAVAFIEQQLDAQAHQMIEGAEVADDIRYTVLRNTAGHLVGAIDPDGSQHYLTGTISEVVPVTSYGEFEYGVLKADAIYNSDSTTNALDNRYWAWVTGPGYVPTSFQGTMNFVAGVAYGGAYPDMYPSPSPGYLGNWWPISGLTGSMTVDLNASEITALNLDMGISVDQWKFVSNNIPLDSAGQFKAQTINGDLSVYHMGNTTPNAWGAVAGSITGAADGAIMSFSAKHPSGSDNVSGDGVTGVAIFRP